MDVIKLDNPQIGAVVITQDLSGLKHNNNREEFVKYDSFESPDLEKKCNFTSWEFLIVKRNQTDEDWNILVNNLVSLNDNANRYFYPDTVNNPTIKYLVLAHFYEDKYNKIPVGTQKFINCNIKRVYANGNEV